MIFDSIILKLKGIMYLVYFFSEIHLFFFVAQSYKLSRINHLFVKFIFTTHILLLWVRDAFTSGEWVSERKRIFIFLSWFQNYKISGFNYLCFLLCKFIIGDKFLASSEKKNPFLCRQSSSVNLNRYYGYVFQMSKFFFHSFVLLFVQ